MSNIQTELKKIDAKIERLKQKKVLIEEILEKYGDDVFDFKSDALSYYKSIKGFVSSLSFKEQRLLNEKISKDIKHEAILLKEKSNFELEKVSVLSYIKLNNKKILVDVSNVGYVFRDEDYNSYNINIEKYPKNIINENVIFQAFMKDVLEINSTIQNTIEISGFNSEVFKEKLKLLIFK